MSDELARLRAADAFCCLVRKLLKPLEGESISDALCRLVYESESIADMQRKKIAELLLDQQRHRNLLNEAVYTLETKGELSRYWIDHMFAAARGEWPAP